MNPRSIKGNALFRQWERKGRSCPKPCSVKRNILISHGVGDTPANRNTEPLVELPIKFVCLLWRLIARSFQGLGAQKRSGARGGLLCALALRFTLKPPLAITLKEATLALGIFPWSTIQSVGAKLAVGTTVQEAFVFGTFQGVVRFGSLRLCRCVAHKRVVRVSRCHSEDQSLQDKNKRDAARRFVDPYHSSTG